MVPGNSFCIVPFVVCIVLSLSKQDFCCWLLHVEVHCLSCNFFVYILSPVGHFQPPASLLPTDRIGRMTKIDLTCVDVPQSTNLSVLVTVYVPWTLDWHTLPLYDVRFHENPIRWRRGLKLKDTSNGKLSNTTEKMAVWRVYFAQTTGTSNDSFSTGQRK